MEKYGKPEGYKNVNTHQMSQNKNKLVSVVLDRDEFQQLLDANEHVLVLKFGAEWCKPCKVIKGHVDTCVSMLPNNITCCDLDVDDSFDLYAYLKSKKQVSGIPCLLAWKSGNTTIAPDASISGASIENITNFFTMVENMKTNNN